MAEQDDRQGALGLASQPREPRHILDEGVPSPNTKIAEGLLRVGGTSMPAMIVGVDMKACPIEEPREVRITKRMLAHPMRYLRDADCLASSWPSITEDFDGVVSGTFGAVE